MFRVAVETSLNPTLAQAFNFNAQMSMALALPMSIRSKRKNAFSLAKLAKPALAHPFANCSHKPKGNVEKYSSLAVEELHRIRGRSERATTAYLKYERMASERERRRWSIMQQPHKPKTIAVLGSSFNPPHWGHSVLKGKNAFSLAKLAKPALAHPFAKYSHKPKTIAVLGGSFNPPHWGHLMGALYAKEKFGVDEVWVVPSFLHRFKTKLMPFDQRLKRLKKLFVGLGHDFKILAIEKAIHNQGKTYLLLKHFKHSHPHYTFKLIVGSDLKNQLQHWHEIKSLKKQFDVLFIPRMQHGPRFGIGNISSTHLRRHSFGK